MKRLILITLLLLVAAFSFSQTNATFNNLDVRNQAKVRSNLFLVPTASPPAGAVKGMIYADTDGFVYYYDGSNWLSFSETSSNRNTLGWYSRKVASDLQFRGVKSTDGYIDFLDSTTYIGLTLDTANLFNVLPDQTETASNRNTEGLYSRKIANDLQFRGIKSTDGYIDFLDSTTYLGLILDTANLFNALPASPQYWTFIDSATDTLKNNVANVDGIIFLDSASLELPPTTATVGQIKQSGNRLLHTYHEKGNNNLFFGQGAGNFTLDSSYNIGIGKGTLSSQTTGYHNLAVGESALLNNTTGYHNTAIGYHALYNNVASRLSTAIGYEAMANVNSTASSNPTLSTAVGYQALMGGGIPANNTGSANTAVGYMAMDIYTTSSYCTAIGDDAMGAVTTGNYNTAIGYKALENTSTGTTNVAIGPTALSKNVGNYSSTAVGYSAMANADSRTSGTARITYNTAVGYESLKGSSTASANTGQYNTGVGYATLDGMTTASFNTVYGYDAGGGITTGDSNIFIGTNAGATLTTESDRLVIDNTNTTTPLIWGNMRTDSLRWNGNVAFVHDLWYEDTYWRDATTSATALAPGVNAPSQRTIVGGINGMGYAPSTQNDISYGQVQLNHDYKFDTDIHSHMHFMIEEAGEAGDTAVFALEYSWADIDETFPTSDTLTILIPCEAITAKQHKLVEFGDITGSGGNFVSSSIIFRLERLQDSDHDTYDGANEYVIVLDVDYHFEIDAPGSRQEIIK